MLFVPMLLLLTKPCQGQAEIERSVKSIKNVAKRKIINRKEAACFFLPQKGKWEVQAMNL